MVSYVIYGKDNCTFCEQAKNLLTQKSLDFVYLELGKDYTREELLEIAPDARTVPQIWIQDGEYATRIGGFKELKDSFDDEVDKLLNEGKVLWVTFRKVDGSERRMLCTKNPDIISESYIPGEKRTDREHKTPAGVIPVYDIEKRSWRSFRADSVISYDIAEHV